MESANRTIEEIKRVEDFVRMLNADAQKIKRISGDGHTYLVGNQESLHVLLHEKHSVTVYFSGSYFSAEISSGGVRFSATMTTDARGGAKVTVDNSSIVAFLRAEEEIKSAWSIAKNINHMSLVERALLSQKQKMKILNNQRKEVEKEINRLKHLNSTGASCQTRDL